MPKDMGASERSERWQRGEPREQREWWERWEQRTQVWAVGVMADEIGQVKETQLKRSFFAVLAGFLVFFVLVGIVWALRGLLSPVLVGFLLSYIANPVVNWTERRWGWPRLLTVSLLLMVIGAIIIATVVWLAPLALEQISQLFANLPDYIDRLFEVLHRGGAVSEKIRRQLLEVAKEPQKVLPVLVRGAARGVGIFATAVGRVVYWGIYVVLMLVFFVTLTSRMPAIKAWCRQFLPSSHREEILNTVQKISDAAGVFLRARLIIAAVMAVVLSAGWAVTGVPYWFLFGVTTAILNIIPYAASVGWVGVLIINGLGADSLHSLFYALLWPTLVYGFAQFLDGWVLSPWLEGGLLRLHPVVVLFAILAGGAVAGALGMVMAIPLAAAWQICFADVIKPRLIEWANTH
ncbi:MAG: AI-2E family transporter [Anaerohalosphaeraceae bacterium]